MIPAIYALTLWMAATPLLFVFFNARRAVYAAFVVGWLFLPKGGYLLAGLPDLNASVSISMGVLIGIALFDTTAFLRIRFRWVDLAMLVFVFVPFASSLANDLGPYDGLSSVFNRLMSWGVPYLCGRAYVRSLEDARELAIAVTLGVLIYLPLCLWEIRMSPTLHHYVYGFQTFKFHTTWRFGGYRPVAFLSHGVEMAMWVTAGALLSIGLWRSRAMRKLYGVPMWVVVVAIIVLVVLCRGLSAWVAFAAAISVFVFAAKLRSRLVLILFVMMPIVYLGARVTDTWNGMGLVDAIAVVSPARAESLQARLYHDQRLKNRALERPIFGWGGWGRQRVYNELGVDTSVTDGFWVIVIGQNGFVGLIAWISVMAGPGLLAVWRSRISVLASPRVLPVTFMILLVSILTVDLMLNAFIGPSLIMMTGAIASLSPMLTRADAVPAVSARHRARPAAA